MKLMNRTAEYFAHDEYRDYLIYKGLETVEKVPEFRQILERLAQSELEHYNFWLQFSKQKEFSISKPHILIYRIMRRILGLTFTVKFLELHEKEAVKSYQEFSKTAPSDVQSKLQEIIDREVNHEIELISNIKEGKVTFISSIILGVNDSLIELSGVLVGLTFALHNHLLVALTGLITGIAASLSMASSAAMQARYEPGKNPRKVALYTGISYLVVVLLLASPFLVLRNSLVAMSIMLTTVFIIITAVSFYTSVIFDRSFPKQLGIMVLFSVGVSAVSFVIGSLFRSIIGVQI